MTAKADATDAATDPDRTLATARVFDAPRELVFKALTDPVRLARWWGPKGFTNTFHEFDPRPGGRWRYTMHGPDGTDYENECVFVEVAVPERVVFDHLAPVHGFRMTIACAEEGRGTRLTWRMVFESAEECAKVKAFVVAANEQNLHRLGAQLAATASAGEPLVLVRTFDAPRDLVFRAWTDPKHMARWWGPRGFTNPVCELDARPGGAIRIDMRGPDGVVYPMTGEFHEVAEPERLVFTSAALHDEAGRPGLEAINTVTFAERDGRATVTLRAAVVTATPEAAGATAGMRQGWSESLERLAETLVPA